MHLDVSNTLCLNSHIAMATKLEHLATLTANHCRKLTADVGDVVFNQKNAQLKHVCLQRCFQLTKGTLEHGLMSAKTRNSTIETLTYSHLDLRAPFQLVTAATARSMKRIVDAASSLQTLALHCCEGLSPAFFMSLASVAPNLKVLMLGGSTVCTRACMHRNQPGAPRFSDLAHAPTANSDAATSAGTGVLVQSANSSAVESAYDVSHAPRFESVLAMVCRVREDMLSVSVHARRSLMARSSPAVT